MVRRLHIARALHSLDSCSSFPWRVRRPRIMVRPRLLYVCLSGGRGNECRSVEHEQDPASGRWYCTRCGARWRAAWPVVMETGHAQGRYVLWDLPSNSPLRVLPSDLVEGRAVRIEHLNLLQ